MLKDLVKLSRPKHWVKNVFVLMPVPFAVAGGATLEPVGFGMGILGFAMANSAIYAYNDAQDAERDRLHPTKKDRPVAAGRIKKSVAIGWSALLVLLGAALCYFSGYPKTLFVFGTYIALNLIYCHGGKNVPLLDVFLLSSGFVLRVVLGCVLVDAVPSNWLLLCSSTLALFLAMAKRRGDLIRGLDGDHRPSLSGYSVTFLDQGMAISAAITLLAYALYTLETQLMVPGREFATFPFVVFAVLEYLRLAQVHQKGDNPVEVATSSPVLLLCAGGWIGAALFSLPLW